MISSMTYAVGNDTDIRTFPGIIQKRHPNQLDLKYYIPRKFNVNSGKLEFKLGLNNVNTDNQSAFSICEEQK
ncbi:hypothetical protein DPMN_033070 [Dreissena polymorpha]|uniref:Uncharacterized protein n=1 Tax=Dreissena polymorpha TaxID=45954 RepID=A0A9D4RIJ8_DREPO|nr:hypothetical protein DPMN_033070 [Dreissena polymorpha]